MLLWLLLLLVYTVHGAYRLLQENNAGFQTHPKPIPMKIVPQVKQFDKDLMQIYSNMETMEAGSKVVLNGSLFEILNVHGDTVQLNKNAGAKSMNSKLIYVLQEDAKAGIVFKNEVDVAKIDVIYVQHEYQNAEFVLTIGEDVVAQIGKTQFKVNDAYYTIRNDFGQIILNAVDGIRFDSESTLEVRKEKITLKSSDAERSGNRGGDIDVVAGNGGRYKHAGALKLSAGHAMDTDGGDIRIESGHSKDGHAGTLNITAGGSEFGFGGNVLVNAGISQNHDGGDLKFIAGKSEKACGGNVYIETGTGIATGSLYLASGDSIKHDSGHVVFQTGNSKQIAGNLRLVPGSSNSNQDIGGEIHIVAGGNTAPSSIGGGIRIVAGNTTGMDYSQEGSGGQVLLQAGNATNSVGGSVLISSGSSVHYNSGHLQIMTQNSTKQSGYVHLQTGIANLEPSGEIQLTTGGSQHSRSGKIQLHTGVSNRESGSIHIASGITNTNSGQILISSGMSNKTSGNIQLASGHTNGTMSGSIRIASGHNLASQDDRKQRLSGHVEISTGDSSTGNAGTMSIRTGNAHGNVGSLLLQAGRSISENGGLIQILSGTSDIGSSGNINIKSADNHNGTGDVVIAVGKTEQATPGNLILQGGSTKSELASSAGNITLVGGQSTNGKTQGGNVIIQTAHQKAYESSFETGSIHMFTGSSNAGNTGSLLFTTGSVSKPQSLAGNITIEAGSATHMATGGSVSLKGGSSQMSGGNVLLKGGDSHSTLYKKAQNAGSVYLQPGSGKGLKPAAVVVLDEFSNPRLSVNATHFLASATSLIHFNISGSTLHEHAFNLNITGQGSAFFGVDENIKLLSRRNDIDLRSAKAIAINAQNILLASIDNVHINATRLVHIGNDFGSKPHCPAHAKSKEANILLQPQTSVMIGDFDECSSPASLLHVKSNNAGSIVKFESEDICGIDIESSKGGSQYIQFGLKKRDSKGNIRYDANNKHFAFSGESSNIVDFKSYAKREVRISTMGSMTIGNLEKGNLNIPLHINGSYDGPQAPMQPKGIARSTNALFEGKESLLHISSDADGKATSSLILSSQDINALGKTKGNHWVFSLRGKSESIDMQHSLFIGFGEDMHAQYAVGGNSLQNVQHLTTSMVLHKDGSINMGGTSHTGYRLCVSGAVNVDSILISADRRTANNIQDITNATDIVKGVRVVKYTANKIVHVGVFAQDVGLVFPQASIEDSSGKKSVSLNALVAIAVKGLQDTMAHVDENRKDIDMNKDGLVKLKTNLDHFAATSLEFENVQIATKLEIVELKNQITTLQEQIKKLTTKASKKVALLEKGSVEASKWYLNRLEELKKDHFDTMAQKELSFEVALSTWKQILDVKRREAFVDLKEYRRSMEIFNDFESSA